MKILQIIAVPEFAGTRLGDWPAFMALIENNRGATLVLPVFHADASDADSIVADYARYCRDNNLTVETPSIACFVQHDVRIV